VRSFPTNASVFEKSSSARIVARRYGEISATRAPALNMIVGSPSAVAKTGMRPSIVAARSQRARSCSCEMSGPPSATGPTS
jgi:hypothetical protein